MNRLLKKLNDLSKEKNFNLQLKMQEGDHKGDGTVPSYHFKNTIQKFYSAISDADLTILFGKYKTTQTQQTMHYVKFVQDIENVKDYEAHVSSLFSKITEQMRLGKADFYKELEDTDKNMNGRRTNFIDITGFHEVMQRMRLTLKKQEIEAIEFSYLDEDEQALDYRAIIEHYRKYLKSIDKTYDQIYRRDLGNTDLKDVFIQFYRVF